MSKFRLFLLSSLFFFSFVFCCWGQNQVRFEGIYRLFNDILIFEITGFSSNPDIQKFAGVSRIPAMIFSCPKWNDGCRCGTLLDMYLPEHAGVVASSVAYNFSEDGGGWVKGLLAGEQDEFIVSRPQEFDKELKNIEELAQSVSYGNDGNSELESLMKQNSVGIDGTAEKTESAAVRRLLNSQNMLSLYSYGEEVFALRTMTDIRVKTSAFRNRMTRQFYDDKMRVYKKEYWELTGGVSGSKLVKTEFFEYGGNFFPVSARINEGDMRRVLVYNQDGRVVEIMNYKALSEEPVPDKKTEEKYFVLTGRTFLKYTDDGRISEKSYTGYEYKDENSSLITGKTSKKDVYEYKEEDISPDYYYYENDVLRMQTVYSGRNTYVTTLFFDGNHIVESYFYEGKHKKDLYYLNGRLRRTVVYEQE